MCIHDLAAPRAWMAGGCDIKAEAPVLRATAVVSTDNRGFKQPTKVPTLGGGVGQGSTYAARLRPGRPFGRQHSPSLINK
jgi:hypothetical protein